MKRIHDYEKVNKRSPAKERKVDLLIEFYDEFKRTPKASEIYKGEKIGYFLLNIRNGRVHLSTKLKRKLNDKKISLKPIDIKKNKHKKILLLIKFKQEFNRYPKTSESYKKENIGTFLQSIKNGLTSITKSDYNKLIKAGYDFSNYPKVKII